MNSAHTLFVLVLFLASGIAQATSDLRGRLHQSASPFQSAAVSMTYGPDPEETADVVLPFFGGSGAAVVLIHGGGWSAGDKQDMSGEASRLASAGFVVININYRLGKAGDAHTYWPAQLEDVQLAVRWAKKYAQDLRIDPERICAYGASAGGHLALFLGYDREIHPGDRASLYPEFSPAVNCAITFSGPADLTQQSTYAEFSVLPFVGSSDPGAIAKMLRDASPLFLVNEQSVPTLILQGRNDTIVPQALADELDSALSKNRVPHTYQLLDGGHVYQDTPEDQKKAAEQEIVDFLAAQLHL
jgi:acetyl esterase/lipase